MGVAFYKATLFFVVITSSHTKTDIIDTARNATAFTTNIANADCPPWFIYNETSSSCQCGSDLGGIVKCNDNKYAQENAILVCYCMTSDDKFGVIAGSCIYNCGQQNYNKVVTDYTKLPLNISELDEAMCGRKLERTGRLCGKCKEGYHFPAYSYDKKCVKCSTSAFQNWITYICMAFIPLTLFFIFVLVFRISVTSPKMMSYALLAQIFSSPSNVRIILSILDEFPTYYIYTCKVTLAMYGIWNLDFFRTFSPSICHTDELQVLALDYVIAIYPLVLVMLTYVLIQLHARGCLLLNILWLPCKKCYIQFQRKVDAKTSIIDVFASFLVLSYVKFLSVSFDLLVPTKIYNVNGEEVGIFLYYNPEYDYFGTKHLPYGVLALVVTFFFVLLPLALLLLYPLRCFQKLCGNWQALRIFIDSFQGSYKDGVVEGKYDCRCFSAVFFIVRIMICVIYDFNHVNHSTYFHATSMMVFLLLMLLIAVVKPYRKVLSYCVTLDILFLSLLAMWCASAVSVNIANVRAEKNLHFTVAMCIFFGIVPLLYIPILFLKYMWSNPSVRRRILFISHFRSPSLSTNMLLDFGDSDIHVPRKNQED